MSQPPLAAALPVAAAAARATAPRRSVSVMVVCGEPAVWPAGERAGDLSTPSTVARSRADTDLHTTHAKIHDDIVMSYYVCEPFKVSEWPKTAVLHKLESVGKDLVCYIHQFGPVQFA